MKRWKSVAGLAGCLVMMMCTPEGSGQKESRVSKDWIPGQARNDNGEDPGRGNGKVASVQRGGATQLSKGYIAVLDAETGEWVYAAAMKSPNGHVSAHSVGRAPDGSIRVLGSFAGSMSIGDRVLNSNGTYQDIFVGKFTYLYSPIIYPPATPSVVQIWKAAGNDVALQWPAVTQDTRGKAITVAFYVIYMCNFPSENQEDYVKVAQVTGTSWTHAGILATTDRLFYRIAAVYLP